MNLVKLFHSIDETAKSEGLTWYATAHNFCGYYEFNTLAQANDFANLFHAQNQYSLSTFVNIVVL